MGLDIIIKVNEDDEDYSYAFHLSYGGFHSFINEILRSFSFKGERSPFYYSAEGAPDCPETDLSKLDVDEDEPDFIMYKDSILEFEKEGLLDLVPLVLHSDCDGVIPWEKAKNILKLLDKDEIKLWFKLESEFDEEYSLLIEALKNAVENKAFIVFA